MRKSKGRQGLSLPLGLFLAVTAALLLPAAVAPGQQPGLFQPDQVDANASWTGAGANANWNNAANWTAGGPPTGAQTASFDANFTTANQPNVNANLAVGTIHMATGVTQNVTISNTGANILTINGTGIAGTGILIDNANAFTLTIDARLAIGNAQAWTNNSGNLFTVSGLVNLSGDPLTVNGTGDTLMSNVISGAGATSDLIKDGTGTLTLTSANTYNGGTTVNGGTLLVNNSAGSGLGSGNVTVNSSGTLGGTGSMSNALTVNAGGNLAPGNGGNNTGTFTVGGPLTLASGSNFRVDINGTAAGTFDQVVVNTSTVTIGGSNLVVTVGTTLAPGQTFQILTTGSGSSIGGTFAQGSTVVGSDGTVFSISYTGGNGNDVVLTVIQAAVPEPSTWMGGALAIAGLAFTQRRRLRKLMAQRCGVGS